MKLQFHGCSHSLLQLLDLNVESSKTSSELQDTFPILNTIHCETGYKRSLKCVVLTNHEIHASKTSRLIRGKKRSILISIDPTKTEASRLRNQIQFYDKFFILAYVSFRQTPAYHFGYQCNNSK